MRLLFCLFADSIGLLPKHLFRNLLQSDERFNVKKFLRKLSLLFAAMAERDGIFGEYSIKYFNGGLFDSDSIIALDAADIGILNRVAVNYDWSHIAPAIFGTLFERSLDPERRSLIGAHYTSEEDILLLIEPVVMRPLQQRWAHVRDSILVTLGLPTEPATEAVILSEARSAQSKDPDALNPADTARTFLPTKPKRTAPKSLLTSNPEAERLLATWFDELAAVCILDPACGSGNFLYVALRRLLDLWKEAQDFAAHHNIQIAITYAVQKMPSPSQLFGIETEFYAHELASIVVWIGFLQWKHEHNILEHGDPILQKLSNIQHADAIMRYDESQKSDEHPNGKPYEPTWAAADFIIGNPPFLGGQEMLEDLSEKYVHDLRQVYEGRVPGGADLCTYWFEKARQQVKSGKASRVGLLATQSIRGGSNRTVLQRIKDSGDIFWAISDRLWKKTDSRKGEKKAMVQISMVGFDDGSQFEKILDGEVVTEIHPNLRSGLNTTTAHKLKENRGIAFQGPVKVGKFELKNDQAHKMFRMQNPHEKPNTDVIKPWLNANDMKLRPSHRFIIDFNSLDLEAAALYEAPFEYVKKVVKPKRDKNKNKKRREEWWKLGRTGAALKRAQRPLTRLLITGRVGKHRVFLWQDRETVPDSAIVAFARDDDYFFGVLQSKVHEVWARAQGTQLRDVKSGFRYTPKSTFETFPLPWVPKKEPSEDADDRVKAIGDAARELVRLRDNWLNPADATAEELKKLTFTNLYTENPTWLENAHRALDEAVFAAYGWPSSLTPQQILANLLALNHQRAAPANPPH
jgi:type II restriction/modification system DNA methylase subunit YeeA